ncbi:MAG: glycoside hydrolase family 5 protein [Pseudomonadota bacterium]
MTNDSNFPFVLSPGADNPASGGAQCSGNSCLPVLSKDGTQYLVLDKATWGSVGYDICSQATNNTCDGYIGHVQFSPNKISTSATVTFNDPSQYSADTNFDWNNDHKLTVTIKKTNIPLPTPSSYTTLPFRGINLSGAEAGDHYISQWMPGNIDAKYFVEKGMNTVRLPINWTYITATPDATTPSPAGQGYLNTVHQSVSDLLTNKVIVILDLHNYMRFAPGGTDPSAGQIVDPNNMSAIWTILSNQFKDLATAYPDHLILEIMNEPHDMSTQDVLDNENAAIVAIRNSGLKNLILLDGNDWTGLHSWEDDNSIYFIPANIKDTENNYALSVHQYFDANSSGTQQECLALNEYQNVAHINEFVTWAKNNGMRAIVTEFGSNANQNCYDDGNYFLQQLEASPDVFLGWTAWVGGHSWTKNSFNNLSPADNGTEQGQMTQIYEKHLSPPII